MNSAHYENTLLIQKESRSFYHTIRFGIGLKAITESGSDAFTD